MAKFVKLTQPSGKPLFINLTNITAMTESPKGTELWAIGESSGAYVVKETVTEILAKAGKT